jgi:phosphopantothenoylcysteine decarboxylase/phosphopantothenate--cysteine ligase
VARVALGVSGGIGAYKAVEIARLLQQQGHDVRAVMTRNARRFVGPLTFEAITRHPVITGQFVPGMNADIEHIDLASSIDVLLVAPATANVLAKFAHGMADDFLSALYLATRAPVLMAPAMNTNMWDHPATRENLAALAARGVQFVEPGAGYLACGWIGKGRLAEPEDVAAAVAALLDRRSAAAVSPLTGRRVLISAGPTLEDLDPVRFIGNRSSGRMGFALAEAARARGALVTLVAGPTTATPPAVDEIVRVRSAAEMHAAVTARAAAADVVIMAAAVADYTPVAGSAVGKIEKGGPLTLELARTRDILADLGAARGDAPRPVLVGFAAQTGDPIPAARRKLAAKRVDLIVANDVTEPGSGFDVETNRVTLVGAGGETALPLQSKRDVAAAVLDRVEHLIAGAPAGRLAR